MPSEQFPDLFPVRTLPAKLEASESTVARIRRGDPDYAATVTEFEVGGIKMIRGVQFEAYLQRKLERAEALKAEQADAAQPVKRKVGRPRKAAVRS